MEHLATLERLRQSQRQDYLKVRTKKKQYTNSKYLHRKQFLARIVTIVFLSLSLFLSLCVHVHLSREVYLGQCRQRIAL